MKSKNARLASGVLDLNEREVAEMKNWVIESVGLILFLVLGVAGVIAATQISGFSFDPLGSKSAPYVIGGATILLSLATAATLIKRVRAEESNTAESSEEKERVYTGQELSEVIGLLALGICYILVLFKLRIPFSISTIVFLPTAACLLERSIKGRLPFIALAAGAIIGFGGEFLFTKVFFIDLPTLW